MRELVQRLNQTLAALYPAIASAAGQIPGEFCASQRLSCLLAPLWHLPSISKSANKSQAAHFLPCASCENRWRWKCLCFAKKCKNWHLNESYVHQSWSGRCCGQVNSDLALAKSVPFSAAAHACLLTLSFGKLHISPICYLQAQLLWYSLIVCSCSPTGTSRNTTYIWHLWWEWVRNYISI